ncbi:hypothetical protein L7F22_061719 [Adiantum nelumboides]|nr:hypothetical protein [Adiantum nelumboides]
MPVADEPDLIDQEYADDTLLFLHYSPDVLDTIRYALEVFCVAIGARIKWDKSYGILVGSDDVPTWGPGDFTWLRLDETCRYLGFQVGLDVTPQQQFSPVMQSMRRKLCYWSTQHLSLVGRALVANRVLVASPWLLDRRSQFEDMLLEGKSLKLQLECKEEEHKLSTRALNDKYSAEVVALQNQIRQSQDELTLRDAAVAHLEQELSCLQFSVKEIQQSSEKELQKATFKHQQDIKELTQKLDLLIHEKNLLEDHVLREKNMLLSQLHNVEKQRKQVMTERADFDKRVNESSFGRHSEVYKQKIMRLRKENENLRRQLHDVALN